MCVIVHVCVCERACVCVCVCVCPQVFSHLTVRERCLGASLVCKYWRDLCLDFQFWKHIDLSGLQQVGDQPLRLLLLLPLLLFQWQEKRSMWFRLAAGAAILYGEAPW